MFNHKLAELKGGSGSRKIWGVFATTGHRGNKFAGFMGHRG